MPTTAEQKMIERHDRIRMDTVRRIFKDHGGKMVRKTGYGYTVTKQPGGMGEYCRFEFDDGLRVATVGAWWTFESTKEYHRELTVARSIIFEIEVKWQADPRVSNSVPFGHEIIARAKERKHATGR